MQERSVLVRDYETGDAEATLRIFERAITRTARSRYTEEQVRAWLGGSRDLEQWGAERRRVRTFVAEVGGVVAGFTDLDDDGYVDRLFVDPDHGRRGVARALLAAVLAAARSAGLPELTTHASLVARPVFEREGFRVVHQEEVQRDGVPLVRFLMRTRLAGE
ncbi:GNAT family N-acetyltransferase [Cellulosimicrobium cellulans]|uniref:GNAT family N-acetyltransferase n=1 Tax=Cellulosimicrobium cellulans TaxID=1710 RepID=UPI0014961D16|nr:GNAT family N-acetyltransferase [Cellulosimicrobium cellulans]